MRFAVLYGSMRDDRLGIHLAHYLIKSIEDRGHKVEFFDAKELNLPLLNKRYLDYPKGQAPKQLEDIAESYRQADAFLIISGEYNYSIQPGLKNLLDYFYQEYFYRPSGLAHYSIGTIGGLRSAMQLVQTVWALGMPAIPAFLSIPEIQNKFNEDSTLKDKEIDKHTGRFLDQLEWYARAMKAEREKGK